MFLFQSRFPEEIRPEPGLHIVSKEESEALLKRQIKAAKAIGNKWALHPDNAPKRIGVK